MERSEGLRLRIHGVLCLLQLQVGLCYVADSQLRVKGGVRTFCHNNSATEVDQRVRVLQAAGDLVATHKRVKMIFLLAMQGNADAL